MSLISFNLVPRIVVLACSPVAWTQKGVSTYVSQGVQGAYGFSETSSKSAIMGKRWKVERRGGGQKAHVLDEWTGCHDANAFQDFIVLGVTCQLNVRPPERAEPIGT